MDIPEVLQGRTTVDLWPTTGQVLGIGRNQTYEAAKRGEIPTLRLGKRWVVPVPRLLALLGYENTPAA